MGTSGQHLRPEELAPVVNPEACPLRTYGV